MYTQLLTLPTNQVISCLIKSLPHNILLHPHEAKEPSFTCKKEVVWQYFDKKNLHTNYCLSFRIFHAFLPRRAWFTKVVFLVPKFPTNFDVQTESHDFQCIPLPSVSTYHMNFVISLSICLAIVTGNLSIDSVYCAIEDKVCLAKIIRPIMDNEDLLKPNMRAEILFFI